MESIPSHPLLPLSQEQIVLVRQSYNLDTKKINENLDVIEEWCKKQDHLDKALPYLKRNVLERFHILGRGSVEQTKLIIDKVLTIRGMLPEFLPNNPETYIKEFEIFLDNVMIVSLPTTNPIDNSRIFLFRFINKNIEEKDILNIAKFCCLITEMRLNHDYIFSDRLIFDLKNTKASLITKLNPVLLKKVEVIFSEAYKIRLKGFHLINGPPFVNKIVSLIKNIIKEKLAKRLYVHTSYEELYQVIPREILPKEYGGDQVSCMSLAEQWKEYLKTEDAWHIIENARKIVSNESRRSCFKFNEEYLGLPGSFKQLNVD